MGGRVFGLESTIQNRTNNPLERYNLRLGNEFPLDHPSMCGFIEGVKTIANEYVDLLDRIKQGRATPPVHLPCRIEEIPEAYNIFRQKLSSAAATIIGNSASASAEFVDIFQASTAASAGAIPRPKKTKQSKDFLPVESLVFIYLWLRYPSMKSQCIPWTRLLLQVLLKPRGNVS